VETNHWLHAGLTIATLGLWGISWLAILIGRRIWPWRCRQCGWNAPIVKQDEKPKGREKETLSDAGRQDVA
jgi:hypothetical protein